MAVVNEVAVAGLRLTQLTPLLTDTGARVGFLDIQAALGLDRRSTMKAIDLLVRTGYLVAGRSKPLRFSLTKTLEAVLRERSGRTFSKTEVVDAVAKLIHLVGTCNPAPQDSRISEVTLVGTILNESVDKHPLIEARVTVDVIPGRMAGMQMRRIEKTLLRIDKSVRVSFVLNST